jgi:hypothetical protein
MFFPVLFFALASPAWAYIDPGTGGVLFQLGYLVYFAVMIAFGFIFRPIVKFFNYLKNKLFKT